MSDFSNSFLDIIGTGFDGSVGSTTVSYGVGDGTFTNPIIKSVSNFSGTFTVDDFNNDNFADIAVVVTSVVVGTSSRNAVSVLLGNGSDFIASPVSASIGATIFLLAEDFNQDGFKDLAAVGNQFAGSDPGSFAVMFGDGNGSFNSLTRYVPGYQPIAAAAHDFDNDGRKDLAVVNYSDGQSPNPQGLSILRAGANGRFLAVKNAVATPGHRLVVSGDFNRDGKNDLAVQYGSSSNGIGIYLGDGNNNFSSLNVLPQTGFANSLCAADVNNDGILDLISTTQSPNKVYVRLGNGDGTFGSASSFQAGANPYQTATGDFNSDGYIDLAVANSSSPSVSLLFGNGSGGYSAPTNLVTQSN
ncbi:MAG: VCBS repeat-containing protein [Pyrinomonadaceae bacterium]|nr:VCBS repeat-containing protein [Pyrinomonadaceae bacterium]